MKHEDSNINLRKELIILALVFDPVIIGLIFVQILSNSNELILGIVTILIILQGYLSLTRILKKRSQKSEKHPEMEV